MLTKGKALQDRNGNPADKLREAPHTHLYHNSSPP